MQKKFFAVAAFALAFAFAFSASAAYDFGSTTLKPGSKGAAVSQLQSALNACNAAGLNVDGIYGKNQTEPAVKAFQASKGLTSDGLVGVKTKAALNSCGSVASTNNPSNSQALCPNGMTLASNCSMSPNASNWGSSSAEGYLADINKDSANLVSTVYESQSDKVVNGFRATARLADQRVERVVVTFDHTGFGSANLGKYASSVSLWNGSTKLATLSIADADRNTSTDVFTFNFTGLSSIISKDQIGRFYVSVNANGSIDAYDVNQNWTTAITEVRATSPNGVYVTSTVSNASSVFTFGKFSSNGVKAEVNLASSNPKAAIVTVNDTAPTNEQTLLKFSIKATNSDLNLRKIPVYLETSDNSLVDVVNNVKLYRGSELIDTASVSSTSTSETVYFSNLSSSGNKVTSGSTAEFSVVVDLKQVSGNYSEGTTVKASVLNSAILSSNMFSVQDTNGDQLTNGNSSIRIGSAVGETMTLRVNGVQVTMGSASYSTTQRGGTGAGASDPVLVTYTIPFSVQSFGQTLYVGAIGAFDSAAAGTATTAEAVSFSLNDMSAPFTAITSNPGTVTVSNITLSSDANTETNGSVTAYRIDAGSGAKNFNLNVTLSATGSTAGGAQKAYRVQLNDFRFFTSSDLVTGAANQSLVPSQNYRTLDRLITAN